MKVRVKLFAVAKELAGCDELSVELPDGAVLRLSSISAEPGYGFLTLVPHHEDGEPQELIVPISAIRMLTLSRSEPESPIGFSLPA